MKQNPQKNLFKNKNPGFQIQPKKFKNKNPGFKFPDPNLKGGLKAIARYMYRVDINPPLKR